MTAPSKRKVPLLILLQFMPLNNIGNGEQQNGFVALGFGNQRICKPCLGKQNIP